MSELVSEGAKDILQLLIAGGTLYVAFIAFTFSRKQAKWQKEHDKLSVRPHLVVHVIAGDKNGVSSVNIKLKNVGLGPALFNRFDLTDDGREVTFNEIGDDRIAAYEDKETYGWSVFESDALAANQELQLGLYEFPTQDDFDARLFCNSLQDVVFKLPYRDLYGNEIGPLVQKGQLLYRP